MIQPVLPLILASGSPRRRELLDSMGLTYTVETPDVDESFSGRPSETVMEISRRKAAAVAAPSVASCRYATRRVGRFPAAK